MAYESHWEWWRPEPVAEAETSRGGTASLSFWSLMLFTGVLLFSPQAYFPSLAPLRPALLVIVVGIVSFAMDRWSRGLPIIQWSREIALIGLLIGLGAATLPFSIWPGGSAAVLIEFIKTAAVFVLLSHVITTTARLRQAAWLLTIMAMGLSLFAAYNLATGAVMDQNLNKDRVIGNEGALTKNPNDLALMVNLLLPLTVALFLSATRGWQRNILLAAIAVEAATVALTYSRAGSLTLGVIFLAYLWRLRHRPERTWMYGLVLAGLLSLPLLPSSYFDRLSTITDMQADRTGSAQERWSDMGIAAKTIVSNPLVGAGIGMNMLAMREARGGWRAVHNVYLEHALDLGLPGLALFLVLLVSCLKAVAEVQRRAVPPDLYFLAEGLQISLVAYAVSALFHPVSYHYYFYYIAGLAVGARAIGAADAPRSAELAA